MTTLDASMHSVDEAASGQRRLGAYDAVRVMLATILLIAAALKGYQLATSPTANDGLLTSRWFLIGAVEFELFLAIWLLSGWRRRAAWGVALASFTVFACVALYKALSGAASCGCFGVVEVSPWITLTLDAAIIALLVAFRPLTSTSQHFMSWSSRRRLAAGAASMLALGVLSGAGMASYQPASLNEAGDLIGDGAFVVLEPETWVGKPFPLIPYIDIGEQLKTGQWIVVLYRHDCPHCVEEMPKYEHMARENASQADAPKVALIEMPPYAPSHRDPVARGTQCVRGKLNEAREWFVQTPVEILLNKGSVFPLDERRTH